MRKIVLLLVVCCLFPAYTWAGNVDTYGIGSKASALGGAFAAYADDPFAVYYNPAGLVQIKTKVVTAGAMFLDPDLQAKDFTVSGLAGPDDFADHSPVLTIPHLGFALPLNERLTAGLAMYVPYGLHLKWDTDSDFSKNPSSYDCYESWYYRMVVTPGIGYQISDKLSIGIGISLGRSEAGVYSHTYALYALGQTIPGYNQPITANVEQELSDDLNYSFNIGLMYRPVDNVILGLTYRSRADANFEGDLKFTGLNGQEKAVLSSLGFAKYKYDVSSSDVDHPDQVQFGLRYKPNPRLSLEADLVWTRWSIVDNQTLEIDDPSLQVLLGALNGSGVPVTQIVKERNWEDTKQVKIGLEWQVTKILALRLGYFYDPSPVPDSTFDIQWPDADKKTYSIGTGLNLDPWTIDLVAQYAQTEKETELGGESENMDESYLGSEVKAKASGEVWGFGVTVSYVF